MKESDRERERKVQLLSLWQQRPVGKRTENDLALFYREMEAAFPPLLRRRGGDPYRNLMSDLRGLVEQHKPLMKRSKG